MRRNWLVVIGVIVLIATGCCPLAKKPITKGPEPKQPKIIVEQPIVPQTPIKSTVEPSIPTATETEKLIATKGEEIPVVKPTEEHLQFEPASFEPVYFDFDKYNIRTDQQNKLKNLADYLKDNPKVLILIEGHCDERGTDEYNLVLGEQRALRTRNFLIALGISPKRLYTISFGEEKPADPGHNEEAWAKNRRCEFKIKK